MVGIHVNGLAGLLQYLAGESPGMKLPLRASWVEIVIWLLGEADVATVASSRKARSVRCMVREDIRRFLLRAFVDTLKDCGRAHGKVSME